MSLARGPALIRAAYEGGYALPAFNVSNLETIQGVLRAADEAGSPVMVQLSPGAIAYAGYETISQLSFGAADRSAFPVLVHLDHCREADLVRRALTDGFGSVMFDGSRLDYEQNVRITATLAAAALEHGAAIEAELGYIGGSEDTTLEQARAAWTTPAEAADFVGRTGIDVLAPAMGTLHRMPEDSVELDVERIRLLSRSCRLPLALHGGSGVIRDQLARAIAAGVAKVNISSRVTQALAAGIRASWEAEPTQLDLRRFMGVGRDFVTTVARAYIDLCGSAGRATSAYTPAAAEPLFEVE